MLVILYNLWANHSVKGEDGRITVLGTNKFLRLAVRFRQDPCQHSGRRPFGVRTPIRAGSITGVRVIDDFPPFICDSCEYATTTRK